jgi:hypothetical protein
MDELLNKIKKKEVEYDLVYDFGSVELNHKNGLVDVILMQRNSLYKECILLGNYSPNVNDKGIVLFVSKAKYPCFLPFFFLNNSSSNIYNPNDVIISSRGDYKADTSSLDAEFLQSVSAMCSRLGIDSNNLLMVMYHESKFDPKARNPSNGATGLIQFVKDTAIGLGTTVDALYNMSRIEQLVYVEKFLKPNSSKIKNLIDMCMAVFLPSYIGKSETDKFPDWVTKANKGIVIVKDYVDLVLSGAKKVEGILKIGGDGTVSLEQ